MPRYFLATALRHDADRPVRQIPKQSRVPLLHVEDDRSIVRRIDPIYEAVDRCLGTANPALQQRVESPLHIARSQRTPVVKLNPTMEMKYIRPRIANLPALGQSRRDIQILSTRQQIIEDQIVNSFRLGVDSHPRIKIGRT